MSDFKYNEETQEYEYVGNAYDGAPEPEADPNVDQSGAVDLFAPPPIANRAMEQADAIEAQQKAAAAESSYDERPVLSGDFGVNARDLVKSIVNPAAALVTDYVDLGHGLVDVVGQTGELIQGNGFDASKIFDDSDNPLTEARINAFRSETQAGQFANTTARVIVALATLPKLAVKGLVAPLKLLSKAPVAGKVAGGVLSQGGKIAGKAAGFGREGTKATTTALNAIQKGAPSSKAAMLANADDWLKLTYKDVVNAGVEGGRFATAMRSTERAAKGLTKGKASIRTVGEALAWDAFVAFNAAGEGNPMLDETFTDFLDQAGLPNVPLFRTSIRDTGLDAKFKQMGEGLILGSIVSSVMDVARIYRFSRAFQRADDVEKKLIVRALNEEGERLGGAVGRLSDQAESIALLPAARNNYQLLDMELDRVNSARANNQLLEETQANLLKSQQMRVDREAAARIRGAELSTESLQQPRQVDVVDQGPAVSSQPALPPRGELLDQTIEPVNVQETVDGGLATRSDYMGQPGRAALPGDEPPIIPVDVQVIRPPEPTITPQTMRAGFKQYVEARFAEQGPEFISQLLDTTKRLMPRNRVDAIDMLERFPLRYNGLGMMEASESVTNNYLIERGLREGWMTVNPEMMEITYNRKLAFDFDRNEYALKQARALDEAAEIERYDARLLEGGSDPATLPVQDELGRMGARDAFDESATGRSTLGDDQTVDQVLEVSNGDQALVEARRQEQLAAVQEAGAQNAEQLQVDIDAIAAYGDIGSDRQVVAEMLNLDLDRLPAYEVEKIGSRQYQVLDEFGESVDGNTYSTLKGARKGAEVARKAQRKEYVAKARAMADRAADQPVQSRIDVDITDSPAVRGELNLTKRQAEILNELGIPINGTKLDLSQADLSGMSRSINQLMEGATANQRRVLKNILKRVDEKVIDLAPAARRAIEVDKTIAASQKFLKDGEICF